MLFDDILRLERISLFDYREEIKERFPEILAMECCEQDSEYHAEGNVLKHTQMVLDNVFPVLTEIEICKAQSLYLGAVLHDIAKPVTSFRSEEDGRIHSPQHGKVGAAMARDILHRVGNIPREIREQAVALVKSHVLPGRLVRREADWASYFRLSHRVDTNLLYHLGIADYRGRRGIRIQEGLDNVEEFRLWCEEYEVFGKPSDGWVTDTLLDEIGAVGRDRRRLQGEVWSQIAWNQISEEGKARAYLYENRSKKGGDFYITIGIPGSGKSNWLGKNINVQVIAMDRLREELARGRINRKTNDHIFHVAFEQLKEALASKEPVVWEATSVNQERRRKMVSCARSYHAYITAIFFDTPLNVALQRNGKRKKAVPERYVRKLYADLEPPRPWEYDKLIWVETNDG